MTFYAEHLHPWRKWLNLAKFDLCIFQIFWWTMDFIYLNLKQTKRQSAWVSSSILGLSWDLRGSMLCMRMSSSGRNEGPFDQKCVITILSPLSNHKNVIILLRWMPTPHYLLIKRKVFFFIITSEFRICTQYTLQ